MWFKQETIICLWRKFNRIDLIILQRKGWYIVRLMYVYLVFFVKIHLYFKSLGK